MTTPRELLETVGPHSTAEDLRELLDHRETDESHLLKLLRRRELPSPLIEAVSRHDRWNKRHVVRAAVVNHPKTPRTLALRLLPLLFWKEQLRVASNIVLPMPLRVAAENRLKERLPEMEMGEKIALARTAPVGLVGVLAGETDYRLMKALLVNPRLREVDVLSIVRRATTPGPVLRVVAQSEKWVHRPPVKLEIVRHRNTPVHVALSLLSQLRPRTIRALVSKRELPRVVELRAERILAGED